MKFLASRKDVDNKRIAIIGHGEGTPVSLLSAAKEKRIAAVVLVATAGMSGADLVLAQQQHALSKSNLSDVEKQARIDAQKKINDAAITGKGLDALTASVRRQIDNPEFQSVLATDPRWSEVQLSCQQASDMETPDERRSAEDRARAAGAGAVIGDFRRQPPQVANQKDEYPPLRQRSSCRTAAIVDC